MPVVRVTWFEGKETATKQAVAAEITESRASCKTSITGYIFSPLVAKLEDAGGHFWHDAFSTTTS